MNELQRHESDRQGLIQNRETLSQRIIVKQHDLTLARDRDERFVLQHELDDLDAQKVGIDKRISELEKAIRKLKQSDSSESGLKSGASGRTKSPVEPDPQHRGGTPVVEPARNSESSSATLPPRNDSTAPCRLCLVIYFYVLGMTALGLLFASRLSNAIFDGDASSPTSLMVRLLSLFILVALLVLAMVPKVFDHSNRIKASLQDRRTVLIALSIAFVLLLLSGSALIYVSGWFDPISVESQPILSVKEGSVEYRPDQSQGYTRLVKGEVEQILKNAEARLNQEPPSKAEILSEGFLTATLLSNAQIVMGEFNVAQRNAALRQKAGTTRYLLTRNIGSIQLMLGDESIDQIEAGDSDGALDFIVSYAPDSQGDRMWVGVIDGRVTVTVMGIPYALGPETATFFQQGKPPQNIVDGIAPKTAQILCFNEVDQHRADSVSRSEAVCCAITDTLVELRDQPAKESNSIQDIEKDEIVDAIGVTPTNDWYNIRTRSEPPMIGWVKSNDGIACTGPVGEISPPSPATPTNSPTSTPTNTPTSRPTVTKSPTATSTATPTGVDGGGETGNGGGSSAGGSTGGTGTRDPSGEGGDR